MRISKARIFEDSRVEGGNVVEASTHPDTEMQELETSLFLGGCNEYISGVSPFFKVCVLEKKHYSFRELLANRRKIEAKSCSDITSQVRHLNSDGCDSLLEKGNGIILALFRFIGNRDEPDAVLDAVLDLALTAISKRSAAAFSYKEAHEALQMSRFHAYIGALGSRAREYILHTSGKLEPECFHIKVGSTVEVSIHADIFELDLPIFEEFLMTATDRHSMVSFIPHGSQDTEPVQYMGHKIDAYNALCDLRAF